MELFLGKKKIQNNELLDLKESQKDPIIKINKTDKYYTLIMYDIYAPSVYNPRYSPYLHYLNINIYNNNIDNGNIIKKYKPPSPPPKSGNHLYKLELYKHKNKYNINYDISRPNFNLKSFISQNNLLLIESIQFYVIPNNN